MYSCTLRGIFNTELLIRCISVKFLSPSLFRSFSAKGSQILSELENLKVGEEALRKLEDNLTPDDGKSHSFLITRFFTSRSGTRVWNTAIAGI